MNIVYNTISTIKERLLAVSNRILKFSKNRNNRSFRTMVKTTRKIKSKKLRVMEYLAKGNDITPKQAYSRFGVSNLRATISDVKKTVEAYGNWEVTNRKLDNGTTCYGMDFHGYTDNHFAIQAGIV